MLYAGKYMDASALLPLFAARDHRMERRARAGYLIARDGIPPILILRHGAASLLTLLIGVPATVTTAWRG